MDQTGSRRIDDIEVLRALAVGMVVVGHIPPQFAPSLYSGVVYRIFGFWSGVDLFLAISGFVIARSLVSVLTQSRGWPEFAEVTLRFWFRRAWRLLPSAWLWLVVVLVAAACFNRSNAFGPFWANLSGARAAVFYYANIHMAHVFSRQPIGSVFQYWSLSLEEQFYFALPFLILFFRGGWLNFLLVLIVVAQMFLRRSEPGADYLLNCVRSDALALGVLLAIWSGSASHRRLGPRFLSTDGFKWLLPFALVGCICTVSGPFFQPWRICTGLVALLSALAVWIASYDRDAFFPPGKLKRALCWVGARSYAIYLIHIPMYAATEELWFRLDPRLLQPSKLHSAILIGAAVSASLVLAHLNYRFFETPLRRRGARMAERVRLVRSGTVLPAVREAA
jgi:peptidoglycan/LPS O-acetylase OafA/YrhL